MSMYVCYIKFVNTSVGIVNLVKSKLSISIFFLGNAELMLRSETDIQSIQKSGNAKSYICCGILLFFLIIINFYFICFCLLRSEILRGWVPGLRGQSYLLENRDSQQKESHD